MGGLSRTDLWAVGADLGWWRVERGGAMGASGRAMCCGRPMLHHVDQVLFLTPGG